MKKMISILVPTVGRIVHVGYGEMSAVEPAIVTYVPNSSLHIDVYLLIQGGAAERGVPHESSAKPGDLRWRWPPITEPQFVEVEVEIPRYLLETDE